MGKSAGRFKWLKKFEIRHSREISKFSLDCRLSEYLSELSEILFIPQKEKYILSKIASMIMRLYCDCESCASNQLQYIGYIIIHSNRKSYLSSWEFRGRLCLQ